MVVVIVALVGAFVYAIIEANLKAKTKISASNNDNDDLRKEVAELKERMAVIEKIVTDEKYDLKKEFDKL
jgi:cell division protein FtsL